MPHFALLAILGCGAPEERTTFHDEGGDPAGTDEPTAEEEWEATKEFLCEGGVSVFEVCPCDVTVDWSHLTEDMFGEPVEPDSFRTLALAGFTHGSVDDVLDDACDEDSLTQASTAGYVEVRIEGETSADLADMGFLGTPGGTLELGRPYFLSWSDEVQPGVGTRMVALLFVVEDGDDVIEVVWP